MILEEDQIRKLTKRKHRDAQKAVLNALGIEHRERPDGSLVVLEEHVRHLLGGGDPAKVAPAREPNWEGLRASLPRQG